MYLHVLKYFSSFLSRSARCKCARSVFTRLEAGGLSSENLGHDTGAAPLRVPQVLFKGIEPTENYFVEDRLETDT